MATSWEVILLVCYLLCANCKLGVRGFTEPRQKVISYVGMSGSSGFIWKETLLAWQFLYVWTLTQAALWYGATYCWITSSVSELECNQSSNAMDMIKLKKKKDTKVKRQESERCVSVCTLYFHPGHLIRIKGGKVIFMSSLTSHMICSHWLFPHKDLLYMKFFLLTLYSSAAAVSQIYGKP